MFAFSNLSGRVNDIVRGAIDVLARFGPLGVLPGPVLVAIARCVQLRLRRFELLMARVAAGEGRVRARRAVAPVAGEKRAKVRRAARTRGKSLVPRGFGWAMKLSRETGAFGTQLQALLAEPEVAEALRTVPEAGAILGPLLRMFAVEVPDALMSAEAAARREARAKARHERLQMRARRRKRGWPLPPGVERCPGPKARLEKWRVLRPEPVAAGPPRPLLLPRRRVWPP